VRYFRVKNWSQYHRADKAASKMQWVRMDVAMFTDGKFYGATRANQFSWMIVLLAAGHFSNVIPYDPQQIRHVTRVKGGIDLEWMMGKDLIEFTSERGPIQSTIPGVVVEKKDKPKPKRSPRAPAFDSGATREGVDDLNKITGKGFDYTEGNLKMFDRLLRGNYTREKWVRVLEAYRDGNTNSAIWAKSKGQLRWAMRPGEKGGFDKILDQLNDPQPERQETALPPNHPSVKELQEKREAKWGKV